MAEKQEKKPEEKAPAAAPAGEKPASGGLFKSMPVLVGVVMVVEAAVLFAGFKLLGGGPKVTHGAELTASEESEDGGHGGHGAEGEAGAAKVDKKKLVELQVAELKAPNKMTGRTFLYDVSIFVVTKGEHKDSVEQSIKDRDATIKDRIRTIIAQTNPDRLGGGSEPGLETLRRQIRYQLEELLGEGMIEEVLVPRCIPYRTEF